MNKDKVIKSTWLPKEKLLISEISGEAIFTHEILNWKKELMAAFNMIPQGSQFKVFVNMNGFKADDLEAHKEFRVIIPLLLKEYGWKVSYLSLFADEIQNEDFKNRKNAFCVAVAHCHHDESKMTLYNSANENANEKFFTDPAVAERWIKSARIDNASP